MTAAPADRTFLFLQGPHGSYFARLGAALIERGHGVERINLCGGDKLDWPGKSVDYRGTRGRWPFFFDDFVVDHGVTDVILFGDCRPLHTAAHQLAALRRIRVHVVEEGYIRPDFVTFEPDGVNGNSTLSRDPAWYLDKLMSPEPADDLPGVPSSFRRRVRETMRYALGSVMYAPAFPFFRTHRPQAVWLEAIGWGWQFIWRKRLRATSATRWQAVEGTRFFVLPLQLDSDYQIRVHSPFGSMRAALRFIIKSFAQHAPAAVKLVIKRHPLDPGLIGWGALIRRLAQRYAIADRVVYLRDADIAHLTGAAIGVVTVNSTVGTLALNRGVPVAVLGDAIYDIPGIVAEGALDGFWSNPPAPDPRLYRAFRAVLNERCLIRGGFLSEEGLAMLVDGALAKLLGPATVDPRTC